MQRIIAIAGPSGSGKSTVANIVAEKLGLKAIDNGQIFRKMGKSKGMDVIQFGIYAEKHPHIDREFDAVVAAEVKTSAGGAIIQGRLAGWTCLGYDIPAKKIWLTASAAVRASRTQKREGGSLKQITTNMNRRDRDNVDRYKRTYGIDLNDLSVYDVVIDVSDMNVKEAVEAVMCTLPKIWRGKKSLPLMKRKI